MKSLENSIRKIIVGKEGSRSVGPTKFIRMKKEKLIERKKRQQGKWEVPKMARQAAFPQEGICRCLRCLVPIKRIS